MQVAEDVLRLVLHAVLVVDAVARPLLVKEAPRIRPGRVLADAEDADQVASVGREEGHVRLGHVCRQPLSAKRSLQTPLVLRVVLDWCWCRRRQCSRRIDRAVDVGVMEMLCT